MPNTNFVWTDEMIEEYGKYCVLNHTWLQWEDFKKSKQVSKDYKILTCENNSMGIHNFVSPETGCSTNCIETNCKIHSVKRLSDNEVFTIGDICDSLIPQKIEYITIHNNSVCSVGGEKWGCPLDMAKKYKKDIKEATFETTVEEILSHIKTGGFVELKLIELAKTKIKNNA